MGLQPRRQPLGQILLQDGLINEKQLGEALEHQAKSGGALGRVLVELEMASEESILRALGSQAGMEVVDLSSIEISPELVQMVPASVANVYRIVPIKKEGGVLTVAMADPLNVNALDDLRFMLSCDVKGAVSNESAISAAIEKYYVGQNESIDDLISEIQDGGFQELAAGDSTPDLAALESMANQAPVIKLVTLVLATAIKDQASDIHFEPFENEYRIRYRIDGSLVELAPPPKQLALAITSRIKVMAKLDIAERRIPQDGRIELAMGGNPIDLRVSTLPTMHGESVVMRVLDRSIVSLDIERLGLRDDEMAFFRDTIEKPHGIVLVTGPTGSGKTTTLYSMLNEANKIDVKIITTEDPVEYELSGIMQIPINPDIGVTFAECLRNILRQDPDKILVGEIRDKETANIAIEASLTGHLVLTTLHTNDAPSSITRLLDIGVEPYLLAATLDSVIAQRLLRMICVKCKTPYAPTEEMLMSVQLKPEDLEGRAFYYGKGCDACNHTGYRHRTAIFEIMKINTRLRQLVLEQQSTEVLRAEGRNQGMVSLRESGLLKVFDGVSTIEEVIRATQSLE